MRNMFEPFIQYCTVSSYALVLGRRSLGPASWSDNGYHSFIFTSASMIGVGRSRSIKLAQHLAAIFLIWRLGGDQRKWGFSDSEALEGG